MKTLLKSLKITLAFCVFFSGLPCNTAFNWEYQSLAQYHKQRKALRIMNGKCLVAAVAEKPRAFIRSLLMVLSL